VKLDSLAGVSDRARYLRLSLATAVGKRDDIIRISAFSPRPQEAAQIVNAVVRAYKNWHETHQRSSTADLLEGFTEELEQRSQQLRTKEAELLEFRQKHPEAAENGHRGIVVSDRLDQLRQELYIASLAGIQHEGVWRRLQQYKDDPARFRQYVRTRADLLSIGEDDGERDRLEAELRDNQLQLQRTLAGGTVQHSQVAFLQKRIDQIPEEIAELDRKYVQGQLALAEALADEAQKTDKQLKDMYQQELVNVQNLDGLAARYAFIMSERDTIQKLRDSLMERINNLDLNTPLEGLKINVLEVARPAAEPFAPKTSKIMGIALVAGLVIGSGLALVRDWRDQRVRSADEITAILGVPVLGAIPSMPRRRLVPPGKRLRFASGTRESEAYRAVRTALFYGTSREEATTILVTSPDPLDGKTTLVSNLGIAMAQAGQRTLILDADLRKPKQHRIFTGNGQTAGLTDLLVGTTTLEEAIRTTEVDGLEVLAGGQSIPNPSEILSSGTFADMLARLRERYDRILIDSPPVGVVTDAQVLASLSDLTLLVLRAEKSTRQVTQRARDALLTVGARVLGAIVNDVPRKKNNKYGHYNGYGYGYFHNRDTGSNGSERSATRRVLPAADTVACGEGTVHGSDARDDQNS